MLHECIFLSQRMQIHELKWLQCDIGTFHTKNNAEVPRNGMGFCDMLQERNNAYSLYIKHQKREYPISCTCTMFLHVTTIKFFRKPMCAATRSLSSERPVTLAFKCWAFGGGVVTTYFYFLHDQGKSEAQTHDLAVPKRTLQLQRLIRVIRF